MRASLHPVPDDFKVAGAQVQAIAISEAQYAALRNSDPRPCCNDPGKERSPLSFCAFDPSRRQCSTGDEEPTVAIRSRSPARRLSPLQSLPMLPEQEHPCPAEVSHCRGAGEPHENAGFSLAGGIISREGEHRQDGGV